MGDNKNTYTPVAGIPGQERAIIEKNENAITI